MTPAKFCDLFRNGPIDPCVMGHHDYRGGQCSRCGDEQPDPPIFPLSPMEHENLRGEFEDPSAAYAELEGATVADEIRREADKLAMDQNANPHLFKCQHCGADEVGELYPARCGLCGKHRNEYVVACATCGNAGVIQGGSVGTQEPCPDCDAHGHGGYRDAESAEPCPSCWKAQTDPSEIPKGCPASIYCDNCGEELWTAAECGGVCVACLRCLDDPDYGGPADDNYIKGNRDEDDHTG